MKKTLLITTVVLSVLGASTYAMYGQGQGRGQWQGFGRTLTAEQRAQLQSMSPEERQAYIQQLRAQQWLPTQQNSTAMQQGGHYGQGQGRGQGRGQGQGQAHQNMQEDPSQMIANYPLSNLTDEEKEGLYNQYGEEKLARDIYTYAYEKYGVQTFANIAKSEQQHMDAVKALLDRYGIAAPSDYAKDNELYDTLKAKVDEGLEQALNVGVLIEEVDIKDIAELAKQAAENNAQDLLAVYTNIAGGSYNHLKGFLQALKNYGYTLPDVSEYLPGVTVDQLLSLRGPDAKKLFVDYVKEKYGIDLSNYQQQCQQNQTTAVNTARQQQSLMRHTMQNMSQNVRRYVNQEKVQQYKNLIEEKYAAKLDSFSQEKLEEINQKIDELIEKISNSTSYTDTKKEVYINLLLALKESILDRLSADTTDVVGDLLGE